MHPRVIRSLLAAAFCLLLGPFCAHAAELVLLNGQLVDPERREVRAASLHLRDGRIHAIGLPDGSDLQVGENVTRVELRGNWLLPALVDLRVHSGENRSPGHRDKLGAQGTAKVLAGAGISLYADTFVSEDAGVWRAQRDEGPGFSARPRLAGPVITAEGGRGADLPGAHRVRTPQDARDAVRMLTEGQTPVDLVTVIFDRRPPRRAIPVSVLEAVLEACREKKLVCVVEVGNWADVREALASGAVVLCHLPTDRMPSDLPTLLQDRKVLWIPTLAVALDFRQLIQDAELRAEPLLARCAPQVLIDDYGAVRVPQSRFREGREMAAALRSHVEKLTAAGVRWIVGSDSGAVGTVHGWTLHRELWHLQSAGLKGWPLLEAATASPARLLGERRSFVTGERADFLVVNRSPVDDVTVLASPVALVLGGEWVESAVLLDAVLRDVAEVEIPDPLRGMGRGSLFVGVVLIFAVLLLGRRYVKRAAAGGNGA